MKKVLLTTTAIVGLTAPAFAADPAMVSDQPYFHHSHPMTWSGSMSITLQTRLTQTLIRRSEGCSKRWSFCSDSWRSEDSNWQQLAIFAGHQAASLALSKMASAISDHSSYTIGVTTRGQASATAHVSAIEDVIDDFLGGSHSEAMDVLVEAWGNSDNVNQTSGSDASD